MGTTERRRRNTADHRGADHRDEDRRGHDLSRAGDGWRRAALFLGDDAHVRSLFAERRERDAGHSELNDILKFLDPNTNPVTGALTWDVLDPDGG